MRKIWKKNYVSRPVSLMLIIFIIFLAFIIFFKVEKASDENIYCPEENLISEERRETLDPNNITTFKKIDLQGYFLNVPYNFSCDGGYLFPYYYEDVICSPLNRNDFIIIVDYKMKFTTDYNKLINTKNCYNLSGDYLNFNANYYYCSNYDDDSYTVSLGIYKNLADEYSRFTELHLITSDLENNYEVIDYLNILQDFANKSLEIDWQFFER